MAIDKLQKGSTLERSAWMAKVRRLKKTVSHLVSAIALIEDILKYGGLREKRTDARKGGL